MSLPVENESLQQINFVVDLNKYEINNSVNFDFDSALNKGNLIIAKSVEDNTTSGSVVTNFRINDTNSYLNYPYVATVDGKTVYFDENGVSKDGTVQLVIANSEIDTQIIGNNNIFTKIKENKTITISLNSLNFREQVALNVLGKFLEKEDTPYVNSNARIKMLITRAFDYAQEFMNQAVNHRSADVINEPIYKVQILNEEESSS